MRLIARIDLTRLARDLRRHDRHRALVKAVERAAAACSIRDDLRTALSSLRQIERIQHQSTDDQRDLPDWFDETTVTGALFVQAVVLYARATATAGDRQPLLGEAKLIAEHRSTHAEAMEFRNSAIAHYGRGETFVDGPLVKEAVVLSLYKDQDRPKKQIGAYTTRAQHKVAFSARLASLLEFRLGEIDRRYQKLFDDADAELESAVKGDPALGRSLRRFEFDVAAFCASPEAAARMRTQLDDGSVADMNYTVPVPRP